MSNKPTVIATDTDTLSKVKLYCSLKGWKSHQFLKKFLAADKEFNRIVKEARAIKT